MNSCGSSRIALAPLGALLTAFFLLALLTCPSRAIAEPLERLKIYVPSSSDGGWAKTAGAVRRTLLIEGLVKNCDLVFQPGAGGLVGLTEFVATERGNPASVILGGRSLVSAPVHNRSPLSLADTPAVARLIGTDMVVAVSRNSPIRTIADLVKTVRNDDSAVQWIGGSDGGVDYLLVLRLTEALGGNRARIAFDAVPGGGSAQWTRLETEPWAAVVGSFEEFATLAQEHKVRIIAVAGPGRNPLLSQVPTFSEVGVQLTDGDWRGVFAPPGLSREQRDGLTALFQKMVRSKTWQDERSSYYWRDEFVPGPKFAVQIEAERKSVVAEFGKASAAAPKRSKPSFPLAATIGSLVILLTLVSLIVVRNRNLFRAAPTEPTAGVQPERDGHAAAAASSRIEQEFDAWKFSAAEREIGWMLLKGLSFRFIADARGTTERTVREQARSIYAKCGLENRAAFAAYFLEDFVFVAPNVQGSGTAESVPQQDHE